MRENHILIIDDDLMLLKTAEEILCRHLIILRFHIYSNQLY